jgi:hypothetical protein
MRSRCTFYTVKTVHSSIVERKKHIKREIDKV